MKNLAVVLLLLFSAPRAKADLFGGDVAVLMQILQQSILQLTELKSILKSGKDTLGLLEDINRGINDSLSLAETLGLRVDPGIYRDLRRVDQALGAVESIFGRAIHSPMAPIYQNTDQTVAEALSFNNELNDYAKTLDRIGEEIKVYSHVVSPGGAQKLTAQSLGILIHVMNQQMRATGQGLKLQAQAMAVQNKKEKDKTEQYINEGRFLGQKLSSLNPKFDLPRF